MAWDRIKKLWGSATPSPAHCSPTGAQQSVTPGRLSGTGHPGSTAGGAMASAGLWWALGSTALCGAGAGGSGDPQQSPGPQSAALLSLRNRRSATALNRHIRLCFPARKANASIAPSVISDTLSTALGTDPSHSHMEVDSHTEI